MDDQIKKTTTIYDVAHEAGVSVATVSRVLNHRDQVTAKTAQKVLTAISKVDFTPPNIEPRERNLISKHHFNQKKPSIMSQNPLLLFCIPSLTNPFYGELVRGAQTSAYMSGYHLLVHCMPINANSADSLIHLIRDYHIAGVILADAVPEHVLERLSEITPVIQCSEFSPGMANSYVSIDNYSASRKAMEYILSTGRQDIAFFTISAPFYYSRKRLEGYFDALLNAGIVVNEERIIYVPDIDFSLAFHSMSRYLQSAPTPEAIFAISDVLASAAIRAAHKAGLSVPKDLLVVGFDNTDISLTTTPTITTVSQPRFQLGQRTVETLLEQLREGRYIRRQIFLDTELIIRESSTLF